MASKKRKRVVPKRSAKSTGIREPTRERIVHRSIVLFNRLGVRNVSIAVIAADLKISPGNLTYHFKHKRDLSLATLEVLENSLRIVLAKPVAVASPQAAAEQLVLLVQTFWEFRFFFNGLTHLLSADTQIRARFLALRAWALDAIERDITFLQVRGYFLAPRPPNTFALLAENLWSLLLHWLRMQQIESPLARIPDKKALFDSSLRIWSLLQPWMDAAFATELLIVFQTFFVSRPKDWIALPGLHDSIGGAS